MVRSATLHTASKREQARAKVFWEILQRRQPVMHAKHFSRSKVKYVLIGCLHLLLTRTLPDIRDPSLCRRTFELRLATAH
jgi:adenosyl cobinamide kinase/adenosyl cobinamide phosphate guanylyltransferase